jgi:DNA-directed RNA polymerase subunit RPC12/RpoP
MGTAASYRCSSCGYEATSSTRDFDFGMFGTVMTALVCYEHGITAADTGFKVWDADWRPQVKDQYPCPECGSMSPRWDWQTCPNCRQGTMAIDPRRPLINWD